MPLMGSEELQNLLKFACTFCSSALLQQLYVERGMGRFSVTYFFWYRSSHASMGLSKHGSPCDRRFADFQGACARVSQF